MISSHQVNITPIFGLIEKTCVLQPKDLPCSNGAVCLTKCWAGSLSRKQEMVLLTGMSGEGEELSAVGGICVRGFIWGLGLERWMKNTEFYSQVSLG